MKALRLTVSLLGMLAAFFAVAQSSLPQCPVLSVAKVPWTDCQGTITWPDGAKYVGEFRDDKMNGQGTLTWANGSKYVGEFRNGKSTGQGTTFNAGESRPPH